MPLYQAYDISFDEVQDSEYDLGLFSSGYEERCTHVPALVGSKTIGKVLVLGFQELASSAQRTSNDLFFKERWSATPAIATADDDSHIIQALRPYSTRKRVSFLIDYTSMSRIWYAAVLNWSQWLSQCECVSIDFVYSVGQHLERTPPMVIREILAIPGMEGRRVRQPYSVAVFGLGFDGLATLCVLDRLEADVVYAFYASPAAFPDYPDRVLGANHDLLNHHLSGPVLPLPLSSVEQSYRHLVELLSKHRTDATVTVVPMGPKPHVLSAMLAGLKLSEVSRLRVSASRVRAERVGTSGEVVCTRVEFRR